MLKAAAVKTVIARIVIIIFLNMLTSRLVHFFVEMLQISLAEVVSILAGRFEETVKESCILCEHLPDPR